MQQPLILIVEDNPTLQKLVDLMARRRGLQTVVAGTGAAAIQAVRENPDGFSLCLMDWTLPDTTGLELTGTIREMLTRDTPIIAMTGHAMPGDREACLEAGMDDYLLKPFSFEQFNGALSKWLKVEPFPVITPEPGAQQLPPTG